MSQVKSSILRKPQLDFEDEIDNFGIFEPKIKFKHNWIRPLSKSIVLKINENGDFYYSHPYEIEIKSYQLLDEYFIKPDYPACIFLEYPKPINKIYFKFIDTENNLYELLTYLKIVPEFAVDLEYHKERSFLGFTCLLQISTRDKNFIIDTIKLRSKMYILNEVFTDPNILKVFHGAVYDIKWLQKDFGIYVVNMFDTLRAAQLLKFEKCSLASLVKLYCDKNLDKSYQLDDWRIRPLTQDMLSYACLDTHFLLYIFDRLRNDLIDKGGIELLRQAFEESRRICLLRFEIPKMDPHYVNHLNDQQRQAFKMIYLWRDNLARTEDESTGYILPNRMMLKIAEELPQDEQGILECCNPVPVMVKQHLNKLNSIVQKAKRFSVRQFESNPTFRQSDDIPLDLKQTVYAISFLIIFFIGLFIIFKTNSIN